MPQTFFFSLSLSARTVRMEHRGDGDGRDGEKGNSREISVLSPVPNFHEVDPPNP